MHDLSHGHMSQGHLFLIPAIIFLLGCVGPKADLWPPAADTPSTIIYVSVDTWHAVIALPHSDSRLTPDASRLTTFEEWGYAERAWYLEGRQGLTGMLRALLWPTEGVVEVVRAQDLWADRTPNPPADLFQFRLSKAGFERIRAYLRSTIADTEPIRSIGESRFYRAGRSYHVFHQCHQYAAQALQQAGLPVSSIPSFTRSTFAWQLHRAVQQAGNDEVAHHRRVGSKDRTRSEVLELRRPWNQALQRAKNWEDLLANREVTKIRGELEPEGGRLQVGPLK
jgi:hypothetical protein